jgi:GNAT superfamily N-acetyltransferase
MTDTVELLKKYWFDEIGCIAADLKTGAIKVFEHGTLQGYCGIIILKKENGFVVSAPSRLVDTTVKKLTNFSTETIFDIAFLEAAFKFEVERLIGPAWIGQMSADSFSACHGPESRELGESDHAVFKAFIDACPKIEVEFSGLEWGHFPMVGVFDGETLVAASGYEVRQGILAHIGVLAHPDFRGRGYACKAVSQITSMLLEKNLGIQYQTLMSNLPSIIVARKLGFTEFAQTIAIRLKK